MKSRLPVAALSVILAALTAFPVTALMKTVAQPAMGALKAGMTLSPSVLKTMTAWGLTGAMDAVADERQAQRR